MTTWALSFHASGRTSPPAGPRALRPGTKKREMTMGKNNDKPQTDPKTGTTRLPLDVVAKPGGKGK
jgi:hypothetical protein